VHSINDYWRILEIKNTPVNYNSGIFWNLLKPLFCEFWSLQARAICKPAYPPGMCMGALVYNNPLKLSAEAEASAGFFTN